MNSSKSRRWIIPFKKFSRVRVNYKVWDMNLGEKILWFDFIDCISVNCEPGKYKQGDECVVCTVGSFKSETGNQECEPCPDGSTTDTVTGATTSTQCDTGKHFIYAWSKVSEAEVFLWILITFFVSFSFSVLKKKLSYYNR